MDFVSGTYSRLLNCCQRLIPYFVEREKPLRTSSGKTTPAPPARGAATVSAFTQRFKDQYFALATAEAQHEHVKGVFQEGTPCVPEMEALVQSCEEALDVLSVAICPEEIYIEQVAVVYEAFHTAFTACNNGKGLAELIFESSKKCDPDAIDELCCGNPAVFQLLVISSVKWVQLAAKAALNKIRRSIAGDAALQRQH